MTVRPGNAAKTARYAATCSSIDGAVSRSRKRNSVRNRPMPSAFAAAASRAPSAPPTFASSGIARPSAVAPCPENAVNFGDARSSATRLSSGSQTSSPVDPSTRSTDPPGAVHTPGRGDDGRKAEFTREDRRVRGRATLLGHEREADGGIEQRGVRRSEVTRDEHVGLGTERDPRDRQTAQLGDDPIAHVVKVGGTLARSAALGGESIRLAGE